MNDSQFLLLNIRQILLWSHFINRVLMLFHILWICYETEVKFVPHASLLPWWGKHSQRAVAFHPLMITMCVQILTTNTIRVQYLLSGVAWPWHACIVGLDTSYSCEQYKAWQPALSLEKTHLSLAATVRLRNGCDYWN